MKPFVPPLLAGLVVMTLASSVKAQNQPSAQPNRPIELPEFIVTGKQRVDIPGSSKQSPLKPPALKSDRLDSLNPTEKQPVPSLPAYKLPSLSRAMLQHPGYFEAQFGNYLTPSIDAGYSFRTGHYLLDFQAKIEASSGWADNADYALTNLHARSTYVAPDDFIFFAGSTTTINVDGLFKNYSLYANPTADRRNMSALNAGVEIGGGYSDAKYSAALKYEHQGLNTANRAHTNSALQGNADVLFGTGAFKFGGEIDLRIQEYATRPYPYTMAGGKVDWSAEKLRVAATLGFQYASNTLDESRLGLLLAATVHFNMNELFTFSGSVGSGLRPTSFGSLYNGSPWLDDVMNIDVPYDIYNIVLTGTYHPHRKITVTGGVRLVQTERDIVYTPGSPGLFKPSYQSVANTSLFADVVWQIGAQDDLLADIRVTSAVLDSNRNKPYVAGMLSSVTHQRRWMYNLRSMTSLVYVGDRWADVQNKQQLSGYIDVRIALVYSLPSEMDIFLRAENLFGSTIVLWHGYVERGTFISGGINWRF